VQLIDWQKIRMGIECHMVLEAWIDHVTRCIPEWRVSIGFSASYSLCSDHSTDLGSVINHHWLSNRLTHFRSDNLRD